jgi:hypothetical protein
LNARILSELTNIIAPTKYTNLRCFPYQETLKANNSIVEITSAYRKKQRIVKSPKLGGSTAIMMIRYNCSGAYPENSFILVVLRFYCCVKQ